MGKPVDVNDRVIFHNGGTDIVGTVHDLYINKALARRDAHVIDTEGNTWRVAAARLRPWDGSLAPGGGLES